VSGLWGRGNAIALGIVAAFTLYSVIAANAAHIDIPPLLVALSMAVAYPGGLVTFSAARLLVRLLVRRPESPFAEARIAIREWRLLDRLIAGLPLVIAIGLFADLFGLMKSAIPAFHPYRLDPVLADLDAMIFGVDPWRVLQPLLGQPWISGLVNFVYNAWALVLLGITLLVASMVERTDLRRQFIVAYLASWLLLGLVLATLLSSVGPCFYEAFYGDRRFAPLMDYLHDANRTAWLPALDVQRSLLEWYRAGDHSVGAGISAMPSMHVSSSLLFAIYGYRLWKPSLWIGAPFLVLICVGSVHLGWHYALDGIVSLILTPVIWWVSGRVLQMSLTPDGVKPVPVAA
jgi:hypothetical protein